MNRINDKDNTAKSGLEMLYKQLGLEKGELVFLGARPAMGKSALALTIVDKYVKEGKSCLYFSLEMSNEQLIRRMLMMREGVIASNESFSDEQMNDIADRANQLADSKLALDDSAGLSVEKIIDKSRQFVKDNYALDLIIVDYYQLISTDRMKDRKDALGEVVKSLKQLAVEMECPVVVLGQLRRIIRDDKRPILEDIDAYDEMKAFLDYIVLMNREDFYEEDTPRKDIADLYISKKCALPFQQVELRFNRKYLRFE